MIEMKTEMERESQRQREGNIRASQDVKKIK